MIRNLAAQLLSAVLLFGCAPAEATDNINITSSANTEGMLQVHFVDVGQADFEYIKFPDGSCAVIDSGDTDDREFVVDYINSMGQSDISFAVATHGHADHIGSMKEILENFNVGTIIRPYEDYDSTLYTNMLYAIEETGTEEVIAKYGDTFEAGGASFEVFGPIGDGYSDYNDYSVVLKMTYGDVSFLFTGDAGKASEKDMLSMGYDLDSDVLKVGHHGSKTASTEEFLEAVSPAVSVISVGENNEYNLPSDEAMERINSNSQNVYRTDEDGTVIVSTDGNTINVETNAGKSSVDLSQNTAGNSENTNSATEDAIVSEVIGNKNTKVYHSPYCSTLPDEKNQIEFSSAKEAEDAGYRPHKNCID